MVSSVKPWVLAKVLNFSFISALGVWVRPAVGRRSRWPLVGEDPGGPTPRPGKPPSRQPSPAGL